MKIKIKTLKIMAILLWLSIIAGMFIYAIKALDIKTSQPQKVYDEPDAE